MITTELTHEYKMHRMAAKLARDLGSPVRLNWAGTITRYTPGRLPDPVIEMRALSDERAARLVARVEPDPILRDELREIIREAQGEVTEKILHLRSLGYEIREIAGLVGLGAMAVHKRMTRALIQLREHSRLREYYPWQN